MTPEQEREEMERQIRRDFAYRVGRYGFETAAGDVIDQALFDAYVTSRLEVKELKEENDKHVQRIAVLTDELSKLQPEKPSFIKKVYD
jgi:hypothetical protein